MSCHTHTHTHTRRLLLEGRREGGREGTYLEVVEARQELLDGVGGVGRVQLADHLQGGREGGGEGGEPLEQGFEVGTHVGVGPVVDVKVGDLGVGGQEGGEDVGAGAGDGGDDLVGQGLGHEGGIDVHHVQGRGGRDGEREGGRAFGGFFEEGVVGLPLGGLGQGAANLFLRQTVDRNGRSCPPSILPSLLLVQVGVQRGPHALGHEVHSHADDGVYFPGSGLGGEQGGDGGGDGGTAL